MKILFLFYIGVELDLATVATFNTQNVATVVFTVAQPIRSTQNRKKKHLGGQLLAASYCEDDILSPNKILDGDILSPNRVRLIYFI